MVKLHTSPLPSTSVSRRKELQRWHTACSMIMTPICTIQDAESTPQEQSPRKCSRLPRHLHPRDCPGGGHEALRKCWQRAQWQCQCRAAHLAPATSSAPHDRPRSPCQAPSPADHVDGRASGRRQALGLVPGHGTDSGVCGTRFIKDVGVPGHGH